MNSIVYAAVESPLTAVLQAAAAPPAPQNQKPGATRPLRTTSASIRFDSVNFNASGLGLQVVNAAFFDKYDVTKIQTLDLSNNKIQKLDPNTFVNFTSLTSLKLNNNLINDIDLAWFVNMPFLTTLNLNNNRLTYLPTGIFYGLTSLTSLDLSYNAITVQSIDNLPFVGLIRQNKPISCPESEHKRVWHDIRT